MTRSSALTHALALAGGLAALAAPAGASPYTFTDFDVPAPAGSGYAGTTVNGISNAGTTVGFSQDAAGNFYNFTRDINGHVTELNPALDDGANSNANGVNSAGEVAGADAGVAFVLSGGAQTDLPGDHGLFPTAAFGVSDAGIVTGQFSDGSGFLYQNGAYTDIAAPAGFSSVNVQGISGPGLAVGFATQGSTSQGFTYNDVTHQLQLLASPNVPDFLFSQVLSVNDEGIAAGYYGTTTGLQHGFLLNLSTDAYTFLDDPNAAPGGSAVMQITGINNAGEIAGFYSDAGGTLHGFTAAPGAAATPEPASWAALGLGALGLLALARRAKRAA